MNKENNFLTNSLLLRNLKVKKTIGRLKAYSNNHF